MLSPSLQFLIACLLIVVVVVVSTVAVLVVLLRPRWFQEQRRLPPRVP
jgi:hypothetical protein